ncbi:LysR family transcriptional regulator [Bordetella petrii]|uniref:LysR family transcriptional regulator n=1 Tax=Bordetella petrii TaxID=94624 RepID=UPI0037339154
MNLSLRDIEYFLEVVEHGHLGRAAAACSVTQPALSKSLQRLEAESGLALLDRSGRSIRLTSAGLVFLQHARKLRAEYRDAVRHAVELRAGQAGLLRVGATGATMDAVVMPVLATLLPRRPALRVELYAGLSDELGERVANGGLDILVAPVYADLPPALRQEWLQDDALCIAAGRRHRLATRKRLALGDLADCRWVLPRPTSMARRAFDTYYAEAGLERPHAALEVEHFSPGMLELVGRAGLLALMPRSALAGARSAGLVELPVALAGPLSRRIAFITRRTATWSPLMTEFHDAVLAFMARPAGGGTRGA